MEKLKLKKLKTLLILLFLFVPTKSIACTVSVPVKKAITSVTLEIVKQAKKIAKEDNCQSILVAMDTPGGSLPVTRLIVQEILNSEVPFLCLIHPAGAQAASAGAIILQACHVSGGIRGTNLGAATPVSLGKDMEKGSDMKKKILNDTLSFVESLTKMRKRNKEFGQQIVSQAKSVTSEEAQKIKAIDFAGDNIRDFLKFSEGRLVEMSPGNKIKVKVGDLVDLPLGFRYSVLTFFADPQILYLMFSGSVLLIYFELTHPGMMVPGIVGGIGLVLSLIGLNTLSVMWGALALIFLGLLFLVFEMLMPSFGILGIGGIISFVIGSIYLFDPLEVAGYQLPITLILIVTIILSSLMFGISYLAFKTFRLKKDVTGMGDIIGQKTEVVSVSSSLTGSKGWLLINGENWAFRSSDKLKQGDIVKVIKYNKMKLEVQKINKENL